MEKAVIMYSYNGILYSKENGQSTSTHHEMDDFSKHNVGEKKPDTKEYVL